MNAARPNPDPPREPFPAHGVAFEYYMFDWDDNVLHMPTKIYLERKTEAGWVDEPVSTADFARMRCDMETIRPREGDWDRAFSEFDDDGHRGDRAFIEDTMAALCPVIEGREPGAPSIRSFKRALIKGRLFAIITARGHSPGTIREGVEYFIDQMLSEEEKAGMVEHLRAFHDAFDEEHQFLSGEALISRYLDLCMYHGVTSPEFIAQTGLDEAGAQQPSEAKKLAVRDFVEHVIRMVREKGIQAPISIGFSDDDKHNVAKVEAYLREELAREFPSIRFVVYDTSEPGLPGGKKVVVQGQLELDLQEGGAGGGERD